MRGISYELPRVVLAGVLLAAAVPAGAGVLEPGQQGGGEDFILNLDDPRFDGETLASRALPFEFIETDTLTGEQIGVRGTLTHSVVRESATGRLAFHYGVEGTEVNATVDFEDLYVRGFQSFMTDTYSSETSLTTGRAIRSADGNEIDFVGDESWGANFVVRTDATAFEEGGEAVVWASIQTGDPAGSPDRFIPFDTFRPTAGDGGEPEPNPIPLPPAAWAALATMGGFGGIEALRRLRAMV